MHTLPTSMLTEDNLSYLEAIAVRETPELSGFVAELRAAISSDHRIVAVSARDSLSPAEAATWLGMSRTHLYKLLDRGDIKFHRVGRDRRIRAHDLAEFAQQRRRDQEELAQQSASQDQTKKRILDTLVGDTRPDE